MKTRKWLFPVIIVAGIITLCLIALLITAGVMSFKGYGASTGRYYYTDSDSYLVDKDKTMHMSDMSDSKNLFNGVSTGDLLLVIHDGIDDSNPSRTGAYKVFRLSKGDESNLPENLDITVTQSSGNPEDVPSASPCTFEAQYIRTDGYHEDIEYPVTRIIRSVDELNAYYEENRELYDLERKDTVYSDTTKGFLDACDKYDNDYFEKHILVMVLLEEGSGSNRHKVNSVDWAEEDRKLYVDIESIVPELGTCDMAEWHILIELENSAAIETESDVIVLLDGVNPLTQPTVASYGRGYANIRLMIPDGWEYETEADEGSNDFGISFWHAGNSEDKISVSCRTGFGVCGTGLEQKDITIGKYKATKGTYDNREHWEFIMLEDTPGTYVILNEADDDWWNEHGTEAMQILNSLVVAEDIITESKAIEIAKSNATVEYNQASASFDMENGIWTVVLYQKNTAGGDQTVTITTEGKVIESTYGE